MFVRFGCRFDYAWSLHARTSVLIAERRGTVRNSGESFYSQLIISSYCFQVKFDKKAKRASSVDDTRFFLLHLGLLREYLELEFISVKEQLKFDYDIERIIDDWIFMCFMVGNDFIPHLPNLHINSNALPTLYRTYREVLPELDGMQEIDFH